MSSSNGNTQMSSKKNPIPSESVFSIMIPWAETWHDEKMIRETLDELEWGEILKVDILTRPNQGGKREHAKVFVHYKSWVEELGVKEHLLKKGDKQSELKVWHSSTHFWKVRASSWKFQDRNGKEKVKPRVEFS